MKNKRIKIDTKKEYLLAQIELYTDRIATIENELKKEKEKLLQLKTRFNNYITKEKK